MQYEHPLDGYLKYMAIGDNRAALACLDEAISQCPHPLFLGELQRRRKTLAGITRSGIPGWIARLFQTG